MGSISLLTPKISFSDLKCSCPHIPFLKSRRFALSRSWVLRLEINNSIIPQQHPLSVCQGSGTRSWRSPDLCGGTWQHDSQCGMGKLSCSCGDLLFLVLATLTPEIIYVPLSSSFVPLKYPWPVEAVLPFFREQKPSCSVAEECFPGVAYKKLSSGLYCIWKRHGVHPVYNEIGFWHVH